MIDLGRYMTSILGGPPKDHGPIAATQLVIGACMAGYTVTHLPPKFLALFEIAQRKPEYEYFFHTVKFLFIKLAMKYLSLNMMEEALFLAFKTKIPEIYNYCMTYANYRKDILSLNLL